MDLLGVYFNGESSTARCFTEEDGRNIHNLSTFTQFSKNGFHLCEGLATFDDSKEKRTHIDVIVSFDKISA